MVSGSSVVLELSPEHLQAIQLHAERAYPNECCGLMLGTVGSGVSASRTVVEVRETDNAWRSEQTEFVTDGLDWGETRRYAIAAKTLLATQREARDRGLAILGVYHSHPDHPATPSRFDQAFAWPEYSYMIISVQAGRSKDLCCWTLDKDDNFQPEALLTTATPPEITL